MCFETWYNATIEAGTRLENLFWIFMSITTRTIYIDIKIIHTFESDINNKIYNRVDIVSDSIILFDETNTARKQLLRRLVLPISDAVSEAVGLSQRLRT